VSDVLTPAQRSFCMSRIRSRNTGPERVVRSTLHKMGRRFRLHRRDLLGTPDIVLPGIKTVIFVHGCFWHMHRCRFGLVKPKTREDFWNAKRQANAKRDRRNVAELRKAGWRVLIVWECQTRNLGRLAERVQTFLPMPAKQSNPKRALTS